MPEPVTRYSAFSIKERLDAGDTVPATFYAASAYDALAQRLAACEGVLAAIGRKGNIGPAAPPNPYTKEMPNHWYNTLIEIGQMAREVLGPAAPASQGWSSARPTKEGWWWYEDVSGGTPYIVKVFSSCDKWWQTHGGQSACLTVCHGQWSGPLLPPA